MQKKITQVSFCDLHAAVVKLQTIKSAACHGSATLSADFLGQLNHADKSWPTLSIVRHPLYTIECINDVTPIISISLAASSRRQ